MQTSKQLQLSSYNFNSCGYMLKFAESIPSDCKAEFTTLVEEDKAVSRASLQGTLDMEDVAACMMA